MSRKTKKSRGQKTAVEHHGSYLSPATQSRRPQILCGCLDCVYYRPNTDSCDYFLITGQRRGCPPGGPCRKYLPGEAQALSSLTSLSQSLLSLCAGENSFQDFDVSLPRSADEA